LQINNKTLNCGEIKTRIQSFLRYAPDRCGGSGRNKTGRGKAITKNKKKVATIDDNDSDDNDSDNNDRNEQ